MTDIASRPLKDESLTGPPRFWTTSGRYGGSLVAVVLGGYLLMRSQLSIAVIQPDRAVEVVAAIVVQFVIAAAVLIAGALIAPTTRARRGVAIITIVVALGIHIVGLATSDTSTPRLLVYALLPATVGAFTAAAVWLIVRGRSGLTLLPLAAFAIIPSVNERLSYTGWSGVVREELTIVAAAVIGIGVAWLAAAIDRSRAS